MDLKEYEHAKFELSAVLRSCALKIENRDSDVQRGVDDLFARLAEDRFNLVVVGRFSRGKSTLMNALIGTERLPTGMVPLTSVITTVGYGTKERAIIQHAGWSLGNEIPLDALPDYVTQQGNPGNQRRVALARVELPSELLRRGFYFVDTPGLGSAIIENTRTTERYLPEADAFMLVTGFDSAFSAEELEILRDAAAASRPVFLVVNKSDLVSREEREQVLAHVREQAGNVFGASPPHVFSVSARDAMEANRMDDAERFAASGVLALKEKLIQFLLEEKQTQFLLRMGERVANVLKQLPDMADTRSRLDALCRRLAQGAAAPPSRLHQAVPAAADSSRFFRCAICDRIEREMYAFLCQYQYDVLARTDLQAGLAERGGLCEFHIWQYETVASPRGTCVGFSGILERLADRLREIGDAPDASVAATEALDRLRVGPESCDLCRAQSSIELATITDTVQRLSKSNGAMPRTCLPHLRMLAKSIPDRAVLRKLLDDEASGIERLAEDMQRYALKHDGIRRFLASEEELHADRRALILLAGNRNVGAHS